MIFFSCFAQQHIRGLYDAELAHIDDQLDRLFTHLKETGQWEDTTVVVCADHGELFGEHGLYGHEFGLYDPLIDVPLLIKHPDLDADCREDQVELVDLYHTALDALDVDPATLAADDSSEAADADPVALDPTRSLLREGYRAFDGAADPDPGQAAVRDRAAAGDGADYAFVEYAQPTIELQQLEEKAANYGVALETDSRYYARMRAARRPDAKYVRRDRVPDEAVALGASFDDETVREVDAATDLDGAAAATERALAAFEERVGGAWTGARDAPGAGTDGLGEFDDEAEARLRDLGYLE